MEKNQKRKWVVIGLLIIILTVLLGGAIFARDMISKKPAAQTSETSLSDGVNWLNAHYDLTLKKRQDQALTQSLIDTFHLKKDDLSPGWSVYGETLDGKKSVAFRETTRMRSASTIKPFIVAAAYQYCLYPREGTHPSSLSETGKNDLHDLSQKAVSESDNEAANALILLIGEGDKTKGFDRINAWCREQGFSQTAVGRLFLETQPEGDNYTSAADCVKLLTGLYQKKIVNAQTSSELLAFLTAQSDRGKIPRYIDGQGAVIANKTGELNADYGMGFVDGDIALVYHEKGGFALAVLMGDEQNHFDETNETISRMAKTVFDAWMSK